MSELRGKNGPNPATHRDGMTTIYMKGGIETVLDTADYPKVSAIRWYATAKGSRQYVRSANAVQMHRIIMDAPKGLVVDHIDLNPLNNRRSNLRLCRQGENCMNRPGSPKTSLYKGVCLDRRKGLWLAQIGNKGQRGFIGYFDDEHDAARAYNDEARRQFGEFAWLNVVPQKLTLHPTLDWRQCDFQP